MPVAEYSFKEIDLADNDKVLSAIKVQSLSPLVHQNRRKLNRFLRFFCKIVKTVRVCKIPLFYFHFASAKRCAEQLNTMKAV